MQNHHPSLAVLAALCVLGACSKNDPDPAPAPVDDSAPTALPRSGDWFAYSQLTTPTVPAGSAVTQRSVTRQFPTVNSDRSFTRVETWGDSTNLLATRSYDTANAQTAFVTLQQSCGYTPAYRSVPPAGTRVGQSYTASSTSQCTFSTGGGLTSTLLISGQGVALEDRTIPLGTFSTYKYTQTITSTTSTNVSTTVESCWIDRATGRTVECNSTYSNTTPGQSTPSASGTQVFRLEAYSFNGQAPVGPAVRRFAGFWSFTLGSSGICANLLIDNAGQLSGSCTLSALGMSEPPITVTGSVTASGAITVSGPGAVSLSGQLTSPSAGSGSWTRSGGLGTWTATHR